MRSRLIQPAPVKPLREAIACNPFGMAEESDEPFGTVEDVSGYLQIETLQQAPVASSKESLLNTMNVGNRGHLQSGSKAQGNKVKSVSLLLSTAPDKRLKCSEFD